MGVGWVGQSSNVVPGSARRSYGRAARSSSSRRAKTVLTESAAFAAGPCPSPPLSRHQQGLRGAIPRVLRRLCCHLRCHFYRGRKVSSPTGRNITGVRAMKPEYQDLAGLLSVAVAGCLTGVVLTALPERPCSKRNRAAVLPGYPIRFQAAKLLGHFV